MWCQLAPATNADASTPHSHYQLCVVASPMVALSFLLIPVGSPSSLREWYVKSPRSVPSVGGGSYDARERGVLKPVAADVHRM